MDDLIGRRIGPYEIRDKLGQGGMATVYRAYQASLNRYVAIKVLPPTMAQDAQFVARFRQEALAAGRLNHPNILRIYDADTFEGRHYIVMDYVSGGTLADRLRSGPLPPDMAADIAAQIADALDHAHRRGIVHRDLKPSNILLDEEGRPLLADFGIAQAMSSGPRLTQTGTSVGTPEYMSPEQGQGLRVDGRSDIYSLGVVLFQMLTGRIPFQAHTPVATLYQVVHQPPPPPRQLNPRIPEYLESITLRALAKNIGARFQSAREMAAALRQRRVVTLLESAANDSSQETQLVNAGIQQKRQREVGKSSARPVSPRVPPAKEKRRSLMSFWVTLVVVLLILVTVGIFTAWNIARQSQLKAEAQSIAAAATAAQQIVELATRNALPTATSAMSSVMPSPMIIEKVVTATPMPTDTPVPPTQTPMIVIVTVLPPTATPLPTVSPTPSHTAAPKPTASPAVAQSAKPAATTAPGVVLDFENFGTWRRGDEPYGSLEQTTEHVHSGKYAARLSYNFPAVERNYVVFRRQPPAAIPGQPTALTLWVYGDGENHFLNAWIRDSAGEVRSFTFGRVAHAGAWQAMTAVLDTTAPWPQDHISGSDNGRLDYPISLDAFVLDGVPDGGGPFSGAIYLDDLATGAAPPAAPESPAAGAPAALPAAVPLAGLSGHIVYTSSTGGAAGVWVLDVANKNTWRLFPNARQPDIRGDGRVVLNTIGGGKDNLFSLNLNGSAEIMNGMHPEDSYPHWSPSGVSAVFHSSLQGDGNDRIYIQQDMSHSEEPRRLRVNNVDIFGRYPTWLENWRIAFTGCDYWASGSLCGIWTVNSNDSGAPTRITDNPQDRSSDSAGGILLYASAQTGNWDVYAIPNGGGTSRNLTNAPSQDIGATFSPDGRFIAYISDRDGWSIWIMNADGSNPTKWLDVPAGFGPNWAEERLAWGP